MSGLSNRFVGGILVAAGIVLSAFHLTNIPQFGLTLDQLLVSGVPFVLAAGMAIVGFLLVRDRLFSSRFAGRMLTWICAGVVAFTLLGGWHFSIIIIRESAPPNLLGPMLNFATIGAHVGTLVGIYDIRGLERQRSIERLHRINDTIRIATQELVDSSTKEELEQAVCDRLAESDPYDGIWLGRYDETEDRVRPVAWSGFEDEYFESLDVTVDDSPTGRGAGGRAVRTGEIQCVSNVFEDPTMEPWQHRFERRGIRSLAAVPIEHDGTTYGFFSVYADRPNVFDEREREVLTELGETIGHAIASIEARERLAERERELERQNERLDAFAGVVSHDLRNPLNVAQGNLELARESGSEKYFDRVADALDRMENLVQELLTLARQGETVDDPVRVSLCDIVDRAWSTASASDAALRIDGDLGVVSCDRARLRQLLENLFRNSIEHGGTTVTVTVRTTANGFVVEDDGPGIPPEERETVFDAGYTTNDDGTGFGLNIVRSIADAHSWDVSIGESADGGARFEFSGVDLEKRDRARAEA